MALTFDYAGAGSSSWVDTTNNSITWSHNASGGANCVVLGAAWVADRSAVTWGMYYGATPMTLVGYATPAGANNFGVAIYKLFNPPTGATTVTFTGTAGTTNNIAMNATTVSYKNVSTVGIMTQAGATSGTAPALSVNSGKDYFAVIGSGTGTLSSPTMTQRVATTPGPYAWKIYCGDARGVSSIAGTLSASSYWAVYAVDVTPIASNNFFSMF